MASSIGFTGSRNGMTPLQKDKLRKLVGSLQSLQSFHHGDCKGADAEAHDIITELCPNVSIIIHPPSNDKMRAYKKGTVLQPKDYIARNHDIVDSTSIMIATPQEAESDPRSQRSGTWATIRYARRLGRPIHIL